MTDDPLLAKLARELNFVPMTAAAATAQEPGVAAINRAVADAALTRIGVDRALPSHATVTAAAAFEAGRR